ncbi:polysaccharide pyruvyl transferase family protein [Vibrio breoganii]
MNKGKTKIGLLNFHYSKYNYGAVLQAAALANVIAELGYNVEHIDYKRGQKHKITPRFILSEGLNFFKIRSFLKIILGKEKPGIVKHKVTGGEVFDDFRNSWIPTGDEEYYFPNELKDVGNLYETVVVGSDQVWRVSPGDKDFASVYFLDFLPDETRRVAYAASFGFDTWLSSKNKKFTNYVGTLLNKFSSVSVRENTGVDICSKVFNTDACHVLDPTLLRGVGYFETIISEVDTPIQKNNIVYYKLDLPVDFSITLKALEDDLSVSSENIYYQLVGSEYKYINVPTWLAKIRDSKLVITDSFHCVCMAILFNKEFICLSNKSRGLTRLESLLSMLDLSDRLLPDDTSDLPHVVEKLTKINFDKVNDTLARHQVKSLDFLANALKTK